MIVYPESHHSNLSAIFFKISENEAAPFFETSQHFLNKIKFDPLGLNDHICYSNHLAKNITHQYELNTQTTKYTQQLLQPVIEEYIKKYENETYLSHKNLTLLNRKNSCWINFQKKFEFHPLHHHFGVLSFVIWLKIPYTISENYIEGKETAPEGDFHFVLRGENSLIPIGLKVDNSWELMGVLFPSNLAHIVYPFYSSNDYRITISGNFKVG